MSPALATAVHAVGRAAQGSLRSRRKDQLCAELRVAVAGRRVLVTGASRGIGRHLALRLADHGAHVAVAARDVAALEALRATGGPGIHPYAVDLAEPGAGRALAARVAADLGPVDVLVNNAGRSVRRPVHESAARPDAERTMRLNYFAAVELIGAVLPGMCRRGDGHLLHISSIGLQLNMPRFSAYNASKAALDAYCRSLAPELPPGVRVTPVVMPLVRTAMSAPTRSFGVLPALEADEGAELVVRAIVARPRRRSTPIGWLGEAAYTLSPALVDRINADADGRLR